MTNKKLTRLGLRSKELLTEAYFDLLKENPKKRVKVKDICDRAEISRPTFYAHYETVEDILQEHLNECLESLFDEYRLIFESNIPLDQMIYEVSAQEFRFWKERIDLFELIQAAGLENLIIQFCKRSVEFSFYRVGRKINLIDDREVENFFISFIAHTTYITVDFWKTSGLKQSPEEIAELSLLLSPVDVINQLAERFNAS